MIKKYRFVDFAARPQKGFRNHVVSIEEVPAAIRQYGAEECYSTYFFYTDEIFAYMNTHVEKDHPSIAGFPGKLWAPFLPLDIDAADVEKALDATRMIGKTLIQEWKIPEEACHFYFSGSKGFHILLDIRLFGKVLPNQHLHQVFSTLRENLMYELPPFDHSVMDLTIKDAVRLLRLPNTINEKSQLYKIPLSAEEIFSNTISEILKKAKKPQTLPYTDETGLVSNVSVKAHLRMEKMFKHVRALIRKYTRKPFVYRMKPLLGENPKDFLCPGFLKIYESSVEPGLRNNAAIRLISEFRLHGLTQEKSQALITGWNVKNKTGLSPRELDPVLHSAYAHPFPYRYGCHDAILQAFCPYQDIQECEKWHKKRL